MRNKKAAPIGAAFFIIIFLTIPCKFQQTSLFFLKEKWLIQSPLVALEEEIYLVKRVLTITKFDPNEKACDHTRHLTGSERVSLLEDLRREMSKVTHREYPKRIRRVLEIFKRSEC